MVCQYCGGRGCCQCRRHSQEEIKCPKCGHTFCNDCGTHEDVLACPECGEEVDD